MTGESRPPYDVFVDWEARLGREMPFFDSLFATVGVERILDAGCGSGMHAISFAAKGFDVVGLDPSEDMLQSAHANATRAGVSVRFERGVFDDAPKIVDTPVDAVISLGNGLPHVAGRAGLESAIDALGTVLRPGGVIVLHVLNHERLIDRDIRMLPPKFRSTPEGDRVFIRTIDHVEDGFVFSFVTLSRDLVGEGENVPLPDDIESAPWTVSEHRSMHTAMPSPMLAEVLTDAGFGEVDLFGDHTGRALDSENDESVIAVARKRP